MRSLRRLARTVGGGDGRLVPLLHRRNGSAALPVAASSTRCALLPQPSDSVCERQVSQQHEQLPLLAGLGHLRDQQQPSGCAQFVPGGGGLRALAVLCSIAQVAARLACFRIRSPVLGVHHRPAALAVR